MGQLHLFGFKDCVLFKSSVLIFALFLLTFKVRSEHLVDKTTRLLLLLHRLDLWGRFIDVLVLLRHSVPVANVEVLQPLLLYRFRTRRYLVQHRIARLVVP